MAALSSDPAVGLGVEHVQRHASIFEQHVVKRPLVEPAVATLVAHGAELYESLDFPDAAAVLALQLDRITRALATAAGENGIGIDVGIGEVLAMLAGTLYEPSRRYLRALLTEPAPDPNAPEAARLIHAACHLRLLQPVEVTRALPGA